MDLAGFGFEHAPVGLVVTRHRQIERCNARFSEIFDYRSAELNGKSIALLYPSPKEFEYIGECALIVMRDRKHYEDQRVMKRSDGRQFWCRVIGMTATPEDPYAHCVWTFMTISKNLLAVQLSQREREIMMYVTRGMTNKEIALMLSISDRTVEAHRSRIMRKIGAKTKGEFYQSLHSFANVLGA